MMKTAVSQPINPFPGLRPFRSDEHHLFFGREEQTAALVQLLRTNRFLAVVGTSGSGKSSLVRAGMIAELHGGTMTQAGSTWEVMILRPGGSPIENLARAFIETDLYDPEDPSTLPRLLATLNRSRFGLVEAIKQCRLFEPGTNLLVVVDQFEELFRFRQQGVDSEETAAAFVNLLLTASEQAECPIYVAITMRSDYLGDCSEIPGLAEAVNDGEYLIPRLLRDQKRDAIEKPIGVGGAKISPMLVQRLLNDVGDDSDQLPVMQHALLRMWDAWSARGDRKRPIDFADFEATGGLGAALSNHADEIYDALPDDRHRSACEKLFKTLTVKGDDNRGIRRPTRLTQLQVIAAADRDTVTAVLDAFRGSGVTFLMPGTEAKLTDRTVLDLSHESLMRGWQRLRLWVEEEAQSARIFRRLLETARLWSDGKAGLFRDPDLQIALSWREQEAPNAAWAEQYGGDFETAIGFLEASNAETEAERLAKEAARQRELEQAQELAESRQLRLVQQQRSTRRLRVMLAGLAFVAGFAVVISIVAARFWRDADRAKRAAELSEQSAQENARSAQSEAERATAQELLAKQARRDAEQNFTRARTAIDNFLIKVSESQLLSAPGLQPLRAELLGSASKFYEDFLAKNPDNTGLQAGLADAFYRVGFVNNELGNRSEALQALDKSIALWDAAVKASPNDRALSHGLAAAWYECGRARIEGSRDNPGGYEAARNAARLWNALVSANPDNIEYKKSLARAYNIMGLTSSQMQDQETAFLAYQQSLRVRLALLPDHPDDVELLHGLGESFNNLGLMVTDRELQRAMLKRSVDYNVQVNRLRPQNVEYASDLAIGYQVNAARLVAANQKNEALLYLRDGVDHVLRFIRSNPAVPAMRQMLSNILSRLRSLPVEPDQADLYARIFRDVRDTYAGLSRKTPEDHVTFAEAQSDCARQMFRARKTIQNRELTPEETAEIAKSRSGAIDSLRQAVAAGFRDQERLKQSPLLADARLLPEFAEIVASIDKARGTQKGAGMIQATSARPPGENVRAQLEQDRATSYLAFGMIATGLDRKQQAKESLEQALSLCQKLADAEPASAQRQAELSLVQAAMAKVLWNEGHLAEAQKLINLRVAALETALRPAPHDQALDVRLANHHRTRADSLAEVALWDEAALQYAAALKSVSNHADSPVYAEILAPALQLLIGDDNAYRTGRAQIAKTYGADSNAEHATRVARLYALRPLTGDDVARIVALAEKAKNSWHAYTYALVLYRAGRFEDAIRTIEDARNAKTYDNILVDNFVLAMAHFRLGRHDRAREFLNAVSGLSPRSMPPWTHFASNMLDVDWIVLRREASELIHGSPFSPDDRLRRSRAFAELKELEKAVAECALAVKALPDSPRGHVACAWVFAQKGRQDQAVQHLEMARPLMDQQRIAIARDVEFWRVYGETLSLLKRHEEATRAIRHAIAAQSLIVLGPRPSNADRDLLSELHASLADAHEAAGRPEESRAARARLAMFTNVFGLRPSIRGVDDLLEDDAPGSRGVDVRIAGIDQLLADNKKSLADHDPIRLHFSARLHQRRAEVLDEGGRPAKEILDAISAAREQYEQLLAIDPSDGSAAADLAGLLLSRSAVPWTPLEPVKVTSKSGTTLSLQSDGSILASGVNPDQDTYTVVAKPVLSRIAAVRLETLPHPTLPRGGSGRDRNGSFALSEFTVNMTRPGKPPGQDPMPVKLTSATASFHHTSNDARQFPIQQAIDGQLATGWVAWPLVYRRQEAVFELEPVSENTTVSTLVIQLTSKGSAEWPPTLGRFRLSVTADPTAFELEKRRFATMNKDLTDPWEKLALAHFVLGDQSALDKLLERHPASASLKGDLRAVAQDWHGAVAEYTTAITPQTKDAKLLAKRAEAYEKLKQWDLAVADWTRASQQQPDVAFERFKPAGAPSWHFFLLNAAAAGSMEVADGALVFTTTVPTGTNWHVQAVQHPLQLDNGAEYVIRFKMKSPDSCAVTVGAQINQPDYHNIGLDKTFVPPTEFRGYEFAFVAHDVVPGNNSIVFHLGMNRGKVMVKEIVILKK